MGEQSNVSSKTCVSNKNLQNKPLICFNNFEDKFLESKLKDICTFYKGKGISKEDISPEGIPCIRYGELYTKYKENIESIFSKTNLPKETLVFSEKGDILIPTSGESAEDIATASCLNRGGIALGSDITILRTKINSLYLAYYINFKKNEIAKLAQGVSIVHLYPKDLKEYKIKYPSLEEQEKVVNFLKLIDLKINSLEKTLVQYQRNKQYFLNLFFNDNSEYSFSSNTKKVKLGSILSLQGGFNFDSKKFNVNAKNKVIKIGDIPNNLNLDKFNGDYSEQDCDEKYIVSNGDIVIALSGATFGKSGLIFGTEQAFINQRVAKFKCENCDYHYIYQLINSQKFKKYLNKIPTSSAQPNISNKDILRYREFIPDLAEQKKIGYFLSLFDRKINFILKSKNNLIEFRRGLLQKMFI